MSRYCSDKQYKYDSYLTLESHISWGSKEVKEGMMVIYLVFSSLYLALQCVHVRVCVCSRTCAHIQTCLHVRFPEFIASEGQQKSGRTEIPGL